MAAPTAAREFGQARTITTTSAAETTRLAGDLATTLVAGDVVLVRGELGVGKTTFIRGACRALGVSGPIPSPSFTIGQLLPARAVEIAHLDLYRLDRLGIEELALLEEYLTPERIAFVEWPEVAERDGLLPTPRFVVTIRHLGGDRRELTIAERLGGA
ncbi:tRNA (adenosine(37)-N6)-threonylcarbamoyltransferase complex ATPase subunit type 1 TsaE [Thermoleophilum album]|uniref:tRNA (adenosine(37)-N6)-threonylcarbamoyltransferase complex ATPase subunit type 1 TsaE n=1 Tax=Thermoleophilum album TaxID=29539 RepID=UPI0019C4D50C|nr:tRNA (adenosine(37)-N6)-threonylcarbamoyltransferase complex ATPase subunit type 1 TsaE [Thermoleophilum album]WDT92935.1 tRNA (adenosine(37)-N6)-threonylcarbamoyltransferase complex ATPase subunit type 1 TsaE [Thermoleophilum album]